MAFSALPPFVGLLTMALLPSTPALKWTKWGMYLLTVPFVLSLFLAWTLIPSNVAGRTKKTIISSATFLGYCVGNMCGSQIFRTADAPAYIPGTIGCAVCLGAQFVLITVWRLYYVWQNKRRDRAAEASGISKEEQERLGRELGEQNVTDLQNPHFRYTLWEFWCRAGYLTLDGNMSYDPSYDCGYTVWEFKWLRDFHNGWNMTWGFKRARLMYLYNKWIASRSYLK